MLFYSKMEMEGPSEIVVLYLPFYMVSHHSFSIHCHEKLKSDSVTVCNFLSVLGVTGVMHIFGRRENHCYVGGMSCGVRQ